MALFKGKLTSFGKIVLFIMIASITLLLVDLVRVSKVLIAQKITKSAITAEQIAAAQKEFASAETGDLVRSLKSGQASVLNTKVGPGQYLLGRNIIGDQLFWDDRNLVVENAKLIKQADTPEFNAAAREFLKQR